MRPGMSKINKYYVSKDITVFDWDTFSILGHSKLLRHLQMKMNLFFFLVRTSLGTLLHEYRSINRADSI